MTTEERIAAETRIAESRGNPHRRHISTLCTCQEEWGHCALDLLDDGTEWVHEPYNPKLGHIFTSKKHGCQVGAEHIEGNRYAVNSCWS